MNAIDIATQGVWAVSNGIIDAILHIFGVA